MQSENERTRLDEETLRHWGNIIKAIIDEKVPERKTIAVLIRTIESLLADFSGHRAVAEEVLAAVREKRLDAYELDAEVSANIEDEDRRIAKEAAEGELKAIATWAANESARAVR